MTSSNSAARPPAAGRRRAASRPGSPAPHLASRPATGPTAVRPARSGRHRVRLLALLASVCLGLGACTGSPGPSPDPTTPADGSTYPPAPDSPGPPTIDTWRRSVPIQPLTVPAEMVAATDRLDGIDVIAGAAKLPALIALIRTSLDGRHRLQVSNWDGTSWGAADVGPGVPGEPQRAALAGSDRVAAIGGWTWEAGTIWPYLLTSTDRATWTPVQLPPSLNSAMVTDVAVEDGRVVALAQGEQGAAATVVVDGAGSGEPVVTFLPAAPDGQRRTLGGLAVAGDTLVLTGRQGPTRQGPLRAFRSVDAGRSWAEPALISPNEQAQAWGVTHLAAGFVVTGTDLIPDDPGENRRMTAWFSPDGGAWGAEPVPEPENFRWSGQDAALGVPTAAGDYVVAVAGSSNSRSSRLFQRQPSGEWIAVGQSDPVADGVGRLGRVAPIVQPSGSDGPGAMFVTIGGAHGTVVGRTASGVWTTDVAPAAYRDPPFFSELVSGRLAVIRQRQFLPFGDGGFRTINEPAIVGLTADALTVRPWDPPEVADAEDVGIGVDGTAEVVLSSRMADDDETHPITGWFRAAPDQPWQPVTGFGAEAFESLGDIKHLGGRWLLRGSRSGDTGGTPQAMLWTSADGIAWARADGDFADGDRSSGIAEVCLDPAGHAVAVGWIRLTPNLPTAAVWSEQDGGWRRSTLPTGPDSRSSFASCSTVGGRLVVTGDLNGDAGRWTLDAMGAPQSTDPPVVDAPDRPRGDPTDRYALDDIGTMPGASFATGRLDTGEYTGPVLWLSADGTRWTWVPVPAADPDASLLVAADGKDLIVLSSATNESRAWRIPELASVIASIPPPA